MEATSDAAAHGQSVTAKSQMGWRGERRVRPDSLCCRSSRPNRRRISGERRTGTAARALRAEPVVPHRQTACDRDPSAKPRPSKSLSAPARRALHTLSLTLYSPPPRRRRGTCSWPGLAVCVLRLAPRSALSSNASSRWSMPPVHAHQRQHAVEQSLSRSDTETLLSPSRDHFGLPVASVPVLCLPLHPIDTLS